MRTAFFSVKAGNRFFTHANNHYTDGKVTFCAAVFKLVMVCLRHNTLTNRIRKDFKPDNYHGSDEA